MSPRLKSFATLATIAQAGAMAAIYGLTLWSGEIQDATAITLMLAVWLLALSWFDYDQYRLPDILTLPLIVAGLLYHLLFGQRILEVAIGAAAGYAFIWTIRYVWQKARRREAIGLGDAKLLAAAGAWLGVLSLPFVLLVSSAAGLFYALVLSWHQKRESQAIPFGPFLSIGFWSVWLNLPKLPAF